MSLTSIINIKIPFLGWYSFSIYVYFRGYPHIVFYLKASTSQSCLVFGKTIADYQTTINAITLKCLLRIYYNNN